MQLHEKTLHGGKLTMLHPLELLRHICSRKMNLFKRYLGAIFAKLQTFVTTLVTTELSRLSEENNEI